MKLRMIALALVFCCTLGAQISSYLGPGILTRGAGDIGTRAGQDVSLRFFVTANGTYDNGIQPYSVDSTGHLVTVNGLWGSEVALGAYGVHNFHRARLGLDYKGTYRHYSEKSYYDGSDHQLALGYTYQKSARLIFDMRQTAGTVSQNTGFGGSFAAVPDAIVTSSSLLFDNRSDFLQSTFDANYRISEHTTVTMGGQGFGIWRKAKGLIGMQGYDFRGSIQRRISQRTTVGASYQHAHYDYPKAFGETDLNIYSGTFATKFGQYWTFSAQAGVSQPEVQGLQRVAVDPEIAALLGVTNTVQTFYRKSLFPQWSVNLDRRFQRANLGASYGRSISSGNGVYLSSRQETGNLSFGYTATTKWSVSVNGGYTKLDGIAQNLQPFTTFTGGGSLSYALTHPIHLVASYDARHQEITDGVFKGTSYRASVGISFSPGDVPLAFH